MILPSIVCPQLKWSYDVFLSFRGEDTRKSFTVHLYSSLCRFGFKTFMDVDELSKGELISTKIEKAIEESRVSIVIFSRNYASSRWCLDELVKIMECREKLNQVVIPVFYDVNPSQVRKQTGCVGEDLAQHKGKSFGAQRMDKWTAALTDAANIAGWVAHRDESIFIESIIKRVQQELNQTLLDVARYPVGVDSRVKDVELLLQSCVDEVPMVGIWGTGGIGKTTLARAIYNRMFLHFDSSCFLSDVGSKAKASNGLVKLQEKLLDQILKTDFKVNSVAEGISMIKRRLRSKKVLIVLDDIDHMTQLESLTRERCWFGSGSLIMITTRHEHLLCNLRANERCKARRLDNNEAMQLFSCHAFNSPSPPQEYVELAQDIIKYLGGLPLTLVMLGSHLQGISIEEWTYEFNKLRAIHHSDILKILRLIFDGLGGDTQTVLLDIARAFHRFSPEEVTKIFNAIDVFSVSEIATLVRKCLLQSAYPFFKIHDLVRDMGREIVRVESLRGPGRRSRLFNTLEIRLLKGRIYCLNNETYVNCDELSLQQDEPKITGMRQQLCLLREVELAFSSGNLMRSTMYCALLQACPSTKSHCQNISSLIDCDESEKALFITTDYSYDSCQSFIPCENCNGCRVSSVVYILHIYAEELHGNFTNLGGFFDVKSSFCNSSFKFSYREEHSSPCHDKPCRFHGTLFLSLFIPTKKSPVGLFEVVYCPQRSIFPFKGQRCSVPGKLKQSSSSPYLNSTVARCSSNVQQMLHHFLQPHEHSTNVGYESPDFIVDTQTNNQKRRKKSSTPWSAAGSISKEYLEQHYGMRLEEAAKSLKVSASTFKRVCRAHGISRWPSAKKMREDASVSKSPNALLSDLQHKERNPSLHQNSMTQGRASSKQEQLYRSQLYTDNISFENPTTNAVGRTPEPPPENGVICVEIRETSISGQNRRRLEREADSTDEMSHFNEKPSEILNYARERQAIDSARKESSSGTIEVGKNPTPESVSVKQSYSSPYLDSTVDDDRQQMFLDFFQTYESSINSGHESPGGVDTQINNQKTINKSISPWSAAGFISREDLVQCYGMRRREAAASLGVSISTFKRLCREHGLSRWPTAKKIRENASIAQSPNALVSALQHTDANLSLNQKKPGNGETANNMTQERASAMQEQLYRSRLYSDTLSFGNPTPNALARMPQPPENLMMYEEERETSISRKKRRRLEREADSMDEMSHFNEQPSESLNCAPKWQAVDSARKKSSCLTSLNGTVEGRSVGYNPTPESVSGHAVRELDSTCMSGELSLGSTLSESLNFISSNENTAQNTKLLFSNLIALPLEDLINSENEASMKKVMSTLADNRSVFSEEQAKQILELKFDFPILVHSWREFSQSRKYSQELFADLEKIRDSVETSMKDEESLKVRYGELESKEKELMAQLELVLKEKMVITEQMHEKFKQTKHLVSLEEEKAARTKEKNQEMEIATTKLNSLVDQWAKIQSHFI